jgi:type III secretion protein U
MDVTEFRKEMRESEGDPELKGMRKQLFQESIFGSSLNAIRKAKVLVLGRRELK